MQLSVIHLLNALALILITIAVPAITSKELGPLKLTSSPDARLLTFGGLGLACGLNAAAALWLARGKKARDTCRLWALAHALLLLVHVLLYRNLIHFNWLKDGLLWIKEKFSR
jgi:hypothetical protein